MSLLALPHLIIAIVLFVQASALTPEPVIRVRELQAELSIARRYAACQSARSALHSARDCRYAGLPFAAYLKLRKACENRSESRAALTACLRTHTAVCSEERDRVDKAVKACSRIGWNGSGRRRDCPNIDLARDQLAAAQRRGCPKTPGRHPKVIERELEEAVEKARLVLGLRSSAYPLRIVESQIDVADTVVILLHGASLLNTGLVPFAERAVQDVRVPPARFLLPQAPNRFLTVLNTTTTLWYDVISPDFADGPWKTGEILAAARNVHDLIAVQRQIYGIKPGRIFVAGFSQGGSVAATVYMRYKVAAAILVSSFLPARDIYPAAMTDDAASSPIIMFQGTADMLLPVMVARTSKGTFLELGREVNYIEYPGESHFLKGVSSDVFSRAVEFALEVLDK